MTGGWQGPSGRSATLSGVREPRNANPWRTPAGLIAVALAITLSGCGSAASTSSSNARASATRSSTASGAATSGAAATTTVTKTTTAGSRPPSSTASSGPPPCRAAGLALRFLGQQGATGHGELGFAVRNAGASPCRTYGYPGVEFLNGAGAPLPTTSQRTTHDFAGPVALEEVVLAPGASASFRLGVTHGNASPAGCTTAHGLQIYPPDDTATLRVTIPDGATECGTATVSPMRPGSSAYP